MPVLPVLAELPGEYEVEESERAALALRRGVAAAFRAAGYGLETDGPGGPSDLAGRRRMLEMEIGGERFVVRRFTHGGLLRWLTGARFLDAERPFREILLARVLEEAQIPTPRVAAARARRLRAGGWALEVVTRRVEGTLDLGRALARMGEGDVSPRLRTRILRAAGELVRAMHEAGFFHADLTPRNLLLDAAALEGGEPRLWVLDLDRSEVLGELGPDLRLRNLARLYRHVQRNGRRDGLAVRLPDLRRFLGGYDPSGRAWKELWRGGQRRFQRARVVHAPGWALERHLGGAQPRRLR